MARSAHAEAPARPAPALRLRFAAHSEPGRSRISALRPLALPAPVTDKLHTRGGGDGDAVDEAALEEATARVRERFALGPRDKYPHPVTTNQEYGWWWREAARARGAAGASQRHHIHDSAWLRTRLRLLAPDAAYKR